MNSLPLLVMRALLASRLGAAPLEVQTSKAAETGTFRLGYSSETISDASDEAAVVTHALVQRLSTRMSGAYQPGTRSFSEIGALKAALKAHELDVVIVTADEYARLDGEVNLDPALSAVVREADSFTIGVLVRRDSEISSLEGLRGLTVLNAKDQSRRVQSVWFETELMKAGHSSSDFLASFKETRSPSQAIMSVFFGQASACVVSLPTFEIASELNPQLSLQLKVIVRSPEVSRGIVAFSADYPKASRDLAYDTMLRLHEDPEGRQILRVFRHERMVPFRVGLLESSRSLLAEHERLLALRAPKTRPVRGAR